MKRFILLLAISLLALTGILALFTKRVFLNASNRNLVIATNHAHYVLESLKQAPFSSIITEIERGSWNWEPQDLTAKGLTPLDNESIQNQASGSNPIQVTVTISWNDHGEKPRSVNLSTLFTNY